MSHVSINFEDTPDGRIAMQVRETGGHNPDSHAHKLAIQVVKFLDAQAESKTDIIVEPQVEHTADNPGALIV